MTTRRRFLLGTLGLPAWVALGCQTPSAPPSQGLRRATGQGDSVPAVPRHRPQAKRPMTPQPAPPTDAVAPLGDKLTLSQAEWEARLSTRQYKVLREGATEDPWTGTYLKTTAPGVYHCAACNNPLFDASTKFDSKTGWPSYWDIVEPGRIVTQPDPRYQMKRTEVLCARCGGHLGHLFQDGPAPTGLRYCVNSIALYFRPA